MNHEHKEAYLRLQGYEPVRMTVKTGDITDLEICGWLNRGTTMMIVVHSYYNRGRREYWANLTDGEWANWCVAPWTYSHRANNVAYRELIAWENMDE